VFTIGTVSSLALGAPEAVTAFVLLIATTFAGAAYSRHWMAVTAGALVLCTAHALHDPASTGGVDLFWVFGLAAISLLLGRALYARQHRIGTLEHDARLAAEQHRQQIATATAAERAALARELHDLVSHAISVIVIQAQAGARALPQDTATAATTLHSIEASARAAMTELRQLLSLLDDPGPAETSPAASLDQLPELLARCRAAGVQLDALLPATLPVLPASTDATAFHVVREALTNCMRHAPGARVALVVRTLPDGLDISVTDTGPAGPGEPSHPERPRRGLIGMRERVGLIGGRLDVGPSGGGFRVHAWLPRIAPAASEPVAGVRPPMSVA
jgi:signal transduction histidine kinase